MKLFMHRKNQAGVKIMWIDDLRIPPKHEELSHATYFLGLTGSCDRGGNINKATGAGEAICTKVVGQG